MNIKTSQLILNDIRLHARHGVMKQEQMIDSLFRVSLSVTTDLSKAALNDMLSDTVNYDSLYRIVKREMAIPAQLIEHVAYRIGREVISQFPQVEEVDVSVTKDNPPMGGDMDGATVRLVLANDNK